MPYYRFAKAFHWDPYTVDRNGMLTMRALLFIDEADAEAQEMLERHERAAQSVRATTQGGR